MKIPIGVMILTAVGAISSLLTCASEVHDIFIQIGENAYFRVDSISQKRTRVDIPPAPSVRSSYSGLVHEVYLQDEALNVPLDDNCFAKKTVSWIELPDNYPTDRIASSIGANDRFAVANGSLIDLLESKYLNSLCAGVVKSAVTVGDGRLLLTSHVANGEYRNAEGKLIGLKFSEREAIIQVAAWTGQMAAIYSTEEKIRKVLPNSTSKHILLVEERVTTNWWNPMNWGRTIAGHPKQTSMYELVSVDLESSRKDVVKLVEGPPGEVVTVFGIDAQLEREDLEKDLAR